jgi:hypothetical protein
MHNECHCFHDAYLVEVLCVSSPCSEEYLWHSYCEMTCSPRQAMGDINLICFIPLLLDIVPNMKLSSKTVFIEIHVDLHVLAI